MAVEPAAVIWPVTQVGTPLVDDAGVCAAAPWAAGAAGDAVVEAVLLPPPHAASRPAPSNTAPMVRIRTRTFMVLLISRGLGERRDRLCPPLRDCHPSINKGLTEVTGP